MNTNGLIRPAWPEARVTRQDVLVLVAVAALGLAVGLAIGISQVRAAVEVGSRALVEHDRTLRAREAGE